MSARINNKIVFEDSDGQSHPFIDMDGSEQISFNLENDAVRNYLNNVTYSKSDIITSSGSQSSTKTKIKPYYRAKAHRNPWGSSESAWSEATRPVVVVGTKSGDEITFASLGHTTKVGGAKGATLVYNLIPRRFYSYTVKRSGNVIKTGYFNTEGQCRMIKIQISNFRDIGGWRCEGGTVAYDKVFRGCGTTGTDAGVYSNLRDAVNKDAVISSLAKLGITHELDLRDPNDDKQPAVNPGYGQVSITYKNVILAAYAINSNTVSALRFISNVLSSGGKIWLHCHTGADRAGTLSVLILILLGCDIDSVIKEWELSMFHGPGYEVTYLENTNFRKWLYNLYKNDKSKSLYDNAVTSLKNNKPAGMTDADIDNIVKNLRSKLIKKTMAVVGDSYSAYTGSGPKVEIEGYNDSSVYAGEYPGYAMPIDKIWWAIVAKRFGWAVANYSWSGCPVTPPVTSTGEISLDERICCSDERINRLSYLTGGTAPDIIFCMVGYNDANAIANDNRYGITIGRLEESYRTMLNKITRKYPKAKVYCLTNVQREAKGNRFNSYASFNTKLASLVQEFDNVSLVDVANVFGNTSIGNTVSDGTHPNETGFAKIANRVIEQIEDDWAGYEPEQETYPESDSYDFIPTHLQPSGFSSGYYDGIVRKPDTYHEYEFAEFPVSAGDKVQIGVNDGTKTLVFFAEYPGGALNDALDLGVGEYKAGWYSGCYEFHWGSIPLKTKTVGSKTYFYAEYTVKHSGRLTVGLKVNNNTSESLGGAFVKINGEEK